VLCFYNMENTHLIWCSVRFRIGKSTKTQVGPINLVQILMCCDIF
jgi:hypothetical protein